jgi:hypothetical protein
LLRIQLKNFSDQLNPTALAKSIVEQCDLIGPERLQDIEQVIFYLQRRVSSKHGENEITVFNEYKREIEFFAH